MKSIVGKLGSYLLLRTSIINNLQGVVGRYNISGKLISINLCELRYVKLKFLIKLLALFIVFCSQVLLYYLSLMTYIISVK